MTPERWAALEQVLDRALELEAGDRSAFLERVCSGDSGLRTEVEQLLRAAETPESFLDASAVAYASPLLTRFAERALPPAGARLGSYQLVRELGRGGMATVFLARDSKHDRDVALKVMHGDIAAGLGTERFLREIRISAQLDHPHILTLIDSGETDGWLWYVLPYVRGESLRSKLNREQQLSVEEAVRIAIQVASALEYAHRHGIIHRDIKPENILLHEGEAVVADYGIAVAVEEAGARGGVPLGTPAYMSPEQATGQNVDARTDVYALAAVLYEMLVGAPPHTGSTAHDVIARMLAEPPPRIRTERADVPEAIDAAIAKALAKAPADRFSDTMEFAAALHAGQRARFPAIAIAVGAALSVGVILWLSVGALGRPKGLAIVVRDRTQITSTGVATMPAISGDGTQLAYVAKRCSGGVCRYAVLVQDIGSGATRAVVDGATAIYSIQSSRDRRFLLFVGSIATRYGSYIVSTAGGAPRFLGVPGAGYFPGSFFPGGDSLLLNNVAWVWVATLDGEHRDSIRIEGSPGERVAGAWPLDNGQWVLVRLFANHGGSKWRIVDRRGRATDSLRTPPEARVAQARLARVNRAGLWIQLQTALVHLRIDARRGKFVGPLDTVPVGLKQSFDVTAAGEVVVFDDGVSEFDFWAVDLADALRGRFPGAPRASSTSFIAGALSPDGRRVLFISRNADVAEERHVFRVTPVTGSGEVLHTSSGTPLRFLHGWMPDGTAFWYTERADAGVQFVTVDARTGQRVSAFPIPESDVGDADPLAGGGWAWIAPSGILHVQRPGEVKPRDLLVPRRGGERLTGVLAAPDGLKLATFGWNQTGDSILVDAVSLLDGRVTHWASLFGEGRTGVMWQGDGSLIVGVVETAGTATLYRVRGPGRVERVGTIPRPVQSVFVARDGRRAFIRTRDMRGDIWLARLDRRSQ